MRQLICSLFAALCLVSLAAAADLRLGIIGTDTSHAPAFTEVLNNPTSKNHIAGARVVAAFKGGSPDINESRDNVEKYATELRDKYQVEIVAKIADLCPLVDGILLESVDGRPHLEQFRQAAKCGKPIFIDKPLAASIEDARQIARLAAEAGIPWFSSSTLRYTDIVKLKSADMTGAIVWAPGPLEPHHVLDLSWYGIQASKCSIP